tara:strand:- start:845 stop:2335 length:1491 start_codon:yes stop_codon:yes gene_type:complete
MPTPTEQPPQRAAPGRLFALCVFLLCLSVIGEQLTGLTSLRFSTAGLLLLFIVLGQGRVHLRERFLLTVALGVALAAFLLPAGAGPGAGVATRFDPAELVLGGLSRAGYLASFMILLSLLQVGAGLSPSVLALGRYLTNQPPGRRYIALHLGGHFFGVLLNFGAISLLAPMIQRGVRSQSADDPALRAAYRERRQLSALARGFSWFNIWAPTSIAQAVVLTTVVGSQALPIALAGGFVAFLLLWVGWGVDRQTGRQARAALAQEGHAPPVLDAQAFPFDALVRFLGVALALVSGGLALAYGFSLPLVTAVMIMALPLTVGWIVLLYAARPGGMGQIAAKLKDLYLRSAPAGSPEAMTLASAGFIGLVGAGLVDGGQLAQAVGLSQLPPTLIYIAVAGLLPLASCLGLPPMLMVTFLGSLLTGLDSLPLDPTLLGLAFLCGWSLNLTGSPFGATSLVLGRVTGVPGTTFAWRWNGIFTLFSFALVAAALLVFSQVWR